MPTRANLSYFHNFGIMTKRFIISKKPWETESLKDLLQPGTELVLDAEAIKDIIACRDYLDNKMTGSEASFYGINTGFGYLQNVKIDNDQLSELQTNLLKSHACGLGEEVPDEIVRLMLVLKAKSLCHGNSGVQLATVQRLLDMYNQDILPIVYTQGSLGASGDLSPLSHLCLPLIGEGSVRFRGKRQDAAALWKELGWEPIQLKSKEGLALINGTQFMSAYGIYCLLKAYNLFEKANQIAAMSFDAFDCVLDPFHSRIHEVRPHPGQLKVAESLRNLLTDSEISKRKKAQVQDPYSFRCIPQVHGASWDAIEQIRQVFTREINSVTDNPNVFPDLDLIVSGGNFHGQPLAINLDFLCIALSELGNISERRTYQLISGLRDLPPFLIKNPGLHSGFMIPQYTAAGIASENKQLCTPASVDSIPSSNNQEDHVSMGANAATKCKRVVDNLTRILAIELLTAAQALDFRRPHKSAKAIELMHSEFRKIVSFNDADRYLHEDMTKAVDFLEN
jgi:histidine ammonia-lyase